MTLCPKFAIAGRTVGLAYPPYVVAEMSANHNGSLEAAFRIIDAAAHAGADAIKIQTYRADTITMNSSRQEFQITSGRWAGRSLHELYEEAHTPWEWHEALFDRARFAGVTMFSSPFDNSAVDLLEDLGAPAYKIASFEIVDIPLIRYVASTRKPMIMSTGMANEEEIAEAIAAARDNGCDDLAVLHCVSSYPAPPCDYNLKTIPDLAKRFGVVTGLSDHTLDNTTAIAAVALGSSIIEKHVTEDRNAGGPDDSFSLEPQDFARLCKGAQIAWEALGRVNYGRKSSEREQMMFRRSLYYAKSMKAGDVLTKDCIRSIRPGLGAAPKHWDAVMGRPLLCDVEAATPLRLDDIG